MNEAKTTLCSLFLLLHLQQETPGCRPVFPRPAERPRTPADPPETLGAEEEARRRRRQEPSFIRRHAGHRQHGLPVQPAVLLPQLPAARQLERRWRTWSLTVTSFQTQPSKTQTSCTFLCRIKPTCHFASRILSYLLLRANICATCSLISRPATSVIT